MRCKYYHDCFTCPFEDCRLTELEALKADAEEGNKKRSPRYEYNHKRYLANRKEVLEKKKIAYQKRKAERGTEDGMCELS